MMKKTIILFAAMVAALGAAATDRFYIEDFSISPGETRTVSILLDNEAEYTAFQCDISLPEGLTASDFELTDRKAASHTFSTSAFGEGSAYRLISYSLKLKPYSGNSGARVTFGVTAAEDFKGPAVITLRKILFTTVAGIEIPFNDETCTVTSTTIRGDLHGDGNVNIADVTALIDLLLGNGGNNNPAADCNGDGVLNIADVTALIDHLLSGTW